MTPFELQYALALVLEHPLHQYVQRTLRRAARAYSHMPRLLDVGGRRSNYTIAVPAEVWLSDIPRENEVQRSLDLGATDKIREKVLKRFLLVLFVTVLVDTKHVLADFQAETGKLQTRNRTCV